MHSLRGRLIGAATVWIAVGMLAAGVMLSAIFRQHVTDQFWEELYVHLNELQRLAVSDSSGTHLQRSISDPRYELLKSGYYWEIQKSGQILARSTSLFGDALKTPSDAAVDIGVHRHSIDGPTGSLLVAETKHTYDPAQPPVQYIIGSDQRHLNAVIQRFNTTLAWALTGSGLSMVAAASMLILYAMRPMQHLRGALSAVRSGRTKSVQGSFPTEVQPLVDDLNTLLNSTGELIQKARTQAGNLAHGLKAPLAILIDEAHQFKVAGNPIRQILFSNNAAKCRPKSTTR